MHLGSILVNNQIEAQFFSYIFIPILYMFRAPMCSSAGESIVLIRHLVYVTLCRWPSDMQVWVEIHVLIIRRINCINMTSGICHCMLVTVWYAGLGWTQWSSNSLHVSSTPVLIIRRINCINTSGICHCMLVTVWFAGLGWTPWSSNSLQVSSTPVLIISRINCINTSGMCHSM